MTRTRNRVVVRSPLQSSSVVPQPSILIIANEEVISALLGAMVELDGYTPAFCAADEQPVLAVSRRCPELVLLDCEHELAWDASAMRAFAKSGVPVLLFSAMRSQHEIDQIAGRYGFPAFVLPVAFREFTTHIAHVLGPQSRQQAIGA